MSFTKRCKNCCRYSQCNATGVCNSYISIADDDEMSNESYIERERKFFHEEWASYDADDDVADSANLSDYGFYVERNYV